MAAKQQSTENEEVLPIYFWKPEQEHGYLSQWYHSPFVSTVIPSLSDEDHDNNNNKEEEEIKYENAEQFSFPLLSSKSLYDTTLARGCIIYMMHRKSLLFEPPKQSPSYPHAMDIRARIMSSATAGDPREIRSLGRKIPGFEEKVWNERRYAIVVEGNLLKFGQDEGLKRKLLGTGERELVEASPRDRIWGVGFAKERAERERRTNGGRGWGKNLLGRALMEVRGRLREEGGGGGRRRRRKEEEEEGGRLEEE